MGLAYLHEGLEPKVVHRDVKSSNILLDGRWKAKVSNFGLTKLLAPEKSYVITRMMGTFGFDFFFLPILYVSSEYANTGMLNEGSDVYSFGILLVEIITGRSPVDYLRPPQESLEIATTIVMAVDESDVLLVASTDEKSDWISDSGSAYHLYRDKEMFSTYAACKGLVRMANNTKTKVLVKEQSNFVWQMGDL
ncbi:probable receptor-like serine/threonine-protein kinase At4g34500 [Actinidia eriantha]|uniref:probable receptor-like serine/threonine-protein kinase At4g34500 n=1 Tax=Actinidia eriantha TaxID=165200 RepID=UPI00258D8671|nr:probable receptor-like serine/threonine-protein kinase At4g34500 [Actinidia eriantha]